MQSERNQSQKDKFRKDSPAVVKFTETGSGMRVAGSGRGGKGKQCVTGIVSAGRQVLREWMVG